MKRRTNFLRSRILILLVLFFVLAGCEKDQTMAYIYSDSSNNNYALKGRILEFTPVTSNRSSSGVYQGRKGFKLKVTAAYNEKLIEAFSQAVANKKAHLEKRLMGSGFIKIKENNGESIYLLSARAVEKIAIDKLLREIKSEE